MKIQDMVLVIENIKGKGWASWTGMMKIRACSTFEVYAVET